MLDLLPIPQAFTIMAKMKVLKLQRLSAIIVVEVDMLVLIALLGFILINVFGSLSNKLILLEP